MNNQSPNFFQESDPTMLHHFPSSSAAVNGGSHQPATIVAPLFSSSMDQSISTNAGGGSPTTTKIQSRPSSLPPQEEPASKRAIFQPHSCSTTATNSIGDFGVHGFTKLSLPSASSSGISPVLRRTTSAPIDSPPPKNPTVDQSSVDVAGNFLTQQFPPVTSAVNSVASSPSAPHHRTISDPTYLSYALAATATKSPSRPPPAARKLIPLSPSNGIAETPINAAAESPGTKKLNRIMDRLREMSQQWNAIIEEGEEQDIVSEEIDNLPIVPKVDESELVSQETEGDESVWVETKGDCLIIHFKCPCSKGYQILICGNSCYYKLT